MTAGVDLALWRQRCPGAPWAEVDQLAQQLAEDGLAELGGGRMRLTARGRLLADSVGLEIMEAFHATVHA
jgi:oxygen-independent coproporphyrinogen-3 oxidase